MAVAYESVSSTAWQSVSSGGNLTITKPTGLAVGDYMVAHITKIIAGSGNANGYQTLSGWTSLVAAEETGNANSSVSCDIQYKVADSGDVAASNFSFVNDNVGNYSIGSIYRISGGAQIAGASDSEIDDTTPAFTNTITPSFADGLLLFLVSSADANAGSQSVSGYAITTSDPTWTERVDVGRTDADGTDRGVHAGATASRPEVTATGNSTCTLSRTQNTIGVIVSITPIVNVTASPDLIGITASVVEPSVTGSANISPSVIDATASVVAPTVSLTQPDWTNTDKSSAGTWTNQDKS